MCIVSVSSLTVALIVTILALVVTICIVIARSSTRKNVNYDLKPKNNYVERNAYEESTHEDFERLPSVRIITE